MTVPIEDNRDQSASPLKAFDQHFDEHVVHPIQPYQARKRYTCPGCSSIIDVGVGHLVVVPDDAADLRRHWHRGCWYKERRRLGHHRLSNPL